MRLNRSLSPLSCLLQRALFTLKVVQPRNPTAPPRARAATHTVKTRQGTTRSLKGQAHIYMERTNQPTMQSHKSQVLTAMEKTHQAITQGRRGRRDPAQQGGQRGWDPVLRRAPAPLEHHRDQGGIKYYDVLLDDEIKEAISRVIRCFGGSSVETPNQSLLIFGVDFSVGVPILRSRA